MSSTYCPVTGSIQVAGSLGPRLVLPSHEYGFSTVSHVSVAPALVVNWIIDWTSASTSSV